MKRSLKKQLTGAQLHTLVQFRADFGMTQDQLALFLGFSRGYIGLMENNQRVMPTAVIMKIEAYRSQVGEAMALKNGYIGKETSVPALDAVINRLKQRLLTVQNKEVRLTNLIRDKNAKNEMVLHAHHRLKIVNTENAGPVNRAVFQLSHLKTSNHIDRMPQRDLDLQIKLELLQAEAEIVQKHLAVLEHEKSQASTGAIL